MPDEMVTNALEITQKAVSLPLPLLVYIQFTRQILYLQGDFRIIASKTILKSNCIVLNGGSKTNSS